MKRQIMQKYQRNRPYKKRKRTNSRASSAKRQLAQVRRAVAITTETKYVDGYYDNANLTQLASNDVTWASTEINPRDITGNYGCLPCPAEGNGYYDRNGRKIFVKNIRIRGVVRFAANDDQLTSTNQPFVRLVVVKDSKTNGSALSAENVLGPGKGSDDTSTVLADASIMAMTKPEGWGRYKVLADKIIRVQPVTGWYDGTGGNRQGYVVPFKMNIPVNCYVNFSAALGNVNSIIDNSFHFLGASGTTNDQTCSISYIARTAFVG